MVVVCILGASCMKRTLMGEIPLSFYPSILRQPLLHRYLSVKFFTSHLLKLLTQARISDSDSDEELKFQSKELSSATKQKHRVDLEQVEVPSLRWQALQGPLFRPRNVQEELPLPPVCPRLPGRSHRHLRRRPLERPHGAHAPQVLLAIRHRREPPRQ